MLFQLIRQCFLDLWLVILYSLVLLYTKSNNLRIRNAKITKKMVTQSQLFYLQQIIQK